ncbi:hypothetical protein NM208_g12422 [Fusarium decemcellulare]|uniref:Uncharacterized protein n=1 Tax=Fusarium decemcellulare TaxID=57161 RepID=A0ACC1RQJ4_9HYPO|nr:hypothetical protein NM208_g12422 [Fusarium decemcellulare]
MAKTRSSGDENAKKMPNQGPAFAGIKKQTKTYAKRPRRQDAANRQASGLCDQENSVLEQEECQQEVVTPDIEVLGRDNIQHVPGLIHPVEELSMNIIDSHYWRHAGRLMNEPLMTNEEVAKLVDGFYGYSQGVGTYV